MNIEDKLKLLNDELTEASIKIQSELGKVPSKQVDQAKLLELFELHDRLSREFSELSLKCVEEME